VHLLQDLEQIVTAQGLTMAQTPRAEKAAASSSVVQIMSESPPVPASGCGSSWIELPIGTGSPVAITPQAFR